MQGVGDRYGALRKHVAEASDYEVLKLGEASPASNPAVLTRLRCEISWRNF